MDNVFGFETQPFVSDVMCTEIVIFRVVLQILVSVHQVIASSCKYLRTGPIIVDRTHNLCWK